MGLVVNECATQTRPGCGSHYHYLRRHGDEDKAQTPPQDYDLQMSATGTTPTSLRQDDMDCAAGVRVLTGEAWPGVWNVTLLRMTRVLRLVLRLTLV